IAIQHLPPRQRAVLILRDVLGWSAAETGELLEMSLAAVKSALQRAWPVLRAHLPQRRATRAVAPTAQERELLRRFIAAHERAGVAAFAELLSEDVGCPCRRCLPCSQAGWKLRRSPVTRWAGIAAARGAMAGCAGLREPA